jgi:hypothetical protein
MTAPPAIHPTPTGHLRRAEPATNRRKGLATTVQQIQSFRNRFLIRIWQSRPWLLAHSLPIARPGPTDMRSFLHSNALMLGILLIAVTVALFA